MQRLALLATSAVVALSAEARAQPPRLAVDVTLGGVSAPGVNGRGHPYGRLGLGVEHGRVSGLVFIDRTAVTGEMDLDGGTLGVAGAGAMLRVDVAQARGLYLHLQVGFAARRLRGDDEVRRGCSVFGGCDAGFYLERPSYRDTAPFVALGFGSAEAGFGFELGIAPLTVDRGGMAPDAHGAMVWMALQFVRARRR